ncbi:hypothetical protein [Halogranum amylolyticum]|nr:hypothetical protein [Halogranum amylolyticum]
MIPLLVDCEIIECYTERSSANRDGSRAYDAAVLDELAALLT